MSSNQTIKVHQLYLVTSAVRKQLFRNNTIETKFRSKAFMIIIYSLLTAPFRLMQTVMFKNRIDIISLCENPPVFIIGHWRSGTTHLHYMMAKDPRFGYLSNYQAFFMNVALVGSNLLKKILNYYFPNTRPQDNMYISLDEPAEEEQPLSTLSVHSSLHGFFFPKNPTYFRKYLTFKGVSQEDKKNWQRDYAHVLKQIVYYNNKRDLVLKNPNNTGRIKELLELFPAAKFVFLHRHPYDLFLSTVHLYRSVIDSQLLQTLTSFEIHTLVINNFKEMLGKYIAERKRIPKGNLVEVAFEDLDNMPLKTIKRVYNILGLEGFSNAYPYINSYLHSVRGYKKNRYTKIPRDIKERINREWDFFFKEFGYVKS